MCGGQQCGLGPPGSEASLGSIEDDVVKGCFQEVNPCCSAGALQREEAGRRAMSVQDGDTNMGKIQGLKALQRQSSEQKRLRWLQSFKP